jgi:protein arginine N-methyltransferase 1
MTYSVPAYIWMVTDAVRVDAYTRAMQSVITPKSFVIEIGTGIGVFAVMAKRMGARRVVAIEPSDAIAVARLLAKDNGEPAIEFIQALAKDVSFSEKADVVVSDLRGVLPLYNAHLQSIIDARERLLAPGGTLIPASDTLYAAVVELPKRYAECTPSFSADGTVKLGALRRFMTSTWEKTKVKPEQLLTRPAPWATIDYRTASGPDVGGTAALTVTRNGTADGVAVWFDATLVEGVGFSNAPDQPEIIYGSAFFPWPEAVDLRETDTVRVRFEARHVGDDYVWRWDSEITAADSAAPAKARFQQSTFQGEPLVPAKLAKRDAAGVPSLNDDGQIEGFILQSMDGAAANADIARKLMERFPDRFARFNDALGRVGSVAQRFGRD